MRSVSERLEGYLELTKQGSPYCPPHFGRHTVRLHRQDVFRSARDPVWGPAAALHTTR